MPSPKLRGFVWVGHASNKDFKKQLTCPYLLLEKNRCLLCRGRGLMQDLTLILSTKNTQQNKTKKRKPKQESIYYKRSGEGFIVKNICCALLPATTSLKMPIMKKTCCVLLLLSFMKSFKMKICCVLLPASLWRRYSCVLLSSSAVYFYQCVYQKLCLRCQVPSREGLYEWDMLPIKSFKKKPSTREKKALQVFALSWQGGLRKI